jgi:hypothetical protein
MTTPTASSLGQQQIFTTGFTDREFALEFVPLDVKATFNATVSLDTFTSTNGFDVPEAVAEINIPYTDQFDKVFYFRSDDVDPSTFFPGSFSDASYGLLGNDQGYVGVNPFNTMNIEFSNSKVINGWANSASVFTSEATAANITTLKQDYVRYTAKSITGGYALSDLFSNEPALLNGVTAMDATFKELFRAKLETFSGKEDPADTTTGAAVLTCKQLVTGLLNAAASPQDTPANIKKHARGTRFLADLAAQSTAAQQGTSTTPIRQKYWVKFHPNDSIALRLTYYPKDGSGELDALASPAKIGNDFIGSNKIYKRIYKVYLKFVTPP